MATTFLSDIKKVQSIVEGRVATLQFDPSNVLTYDVLRLWRHELAKRRADFGDAGKSLFILTSLPIGRVGFNSSSPLLESVRLSRI